MRQGSSTAGLGLRSTTRTRQQEFLARTDAQLDQIKQGERLTFERWDGRGPLGRAKGDEIPLPMRIVAVAVDASFQRLLGDSEHVVRVIGERAGHVGRAERDQAAGRRMRKNRGVRVERTRENVFTVTATGQELSALLAGARLALDAMRASPEAPATAIEHLERVLEDFDRARERLSKPPDGDRR